MDDKSLSLTEQIYAELVDGLKTGELAGKSEWTAFIAKHSASKGPLYNAIDRFLHDMGPKVQELAAVQAKLDTAGLELDSLDQKIKEAESSLAPLEETKNALNEGIETLESKLTEKNELLEHAGELEKLGFDTERLRQLRETLSEIGAKHGLKGKEAVSKFFAELKDYDAKTGFEREIQRLETITGTKGLEAEKWQAEADSLSRRHKDLSEAITAVQSLIKQGVKVEQIVSWNSIVTKLGGPAELQDKLGQYKSMSEFLDTKKREIEDCNSKVTELSAQIKALNEQKVEIEGAIKSLSSSGVKEITKVSDKAITVLKSLSNSGVQEITKVSDKTYAEQNARNIEMLDQFEALNAKAIEVSRQVGAVQEQIKKDTMARDLLILLRNPVSASYEEYLPLALVLLKSISIWANINKDKFRFPSLIDKNFEELTGYLGGS